MMKKIATCLVIGMMVCVFFACGKEDKNSQTTEDELIENNDSDGIGADEYVQDETDDGMNGPNQGNSDILNDNDISQEDENGENVAGGQSNREQTPARMLLQEFEQKVANGEYTTTSELAASLIADERIPFATATMEVEPGYLNGFSKEIYGFEKGTMFGPSIGAIPFVGYVFKLPSDSDGEAFAKELQDQANLRWNVCTQADEMLCERQGDFVFFCMAPASFEEDES